MLLRNVWMTPNPVCSSVCFLRFWQKCHITLSYRRRLSYRRPYDIHTYVLWQYGLWSFQAGGTKLERFLPNNQHTQRKLLNCDNWVNGEVLKIGHPFRK